MQEARSLREFARRCGLSAPTITDIMLGDTKELKVSTLLALAKGSGRTPEEIFAAYLGRVSQPAEDVANDAAKMRGLLVYYFDRVPPVCQLYMVASARGIFMCQDTEKKVFERSAARAATRGMLKADYEQHAATRLALDEDIASREAALAPETVESSIPGQNPDLSPEALPRGNATRKPKRIGYGMESDEDRRRRGAA